MFRAIVQMAAGVIFLSSSNCLADDNFFYHHDQRISLQISPSEITVAPLAEQTPNWADTYSAYPELNSAIPPVDVPGIHAFSVQVHDGISIDDLIQRMRSEGKFARVCHVYLDERGRKCYAGDRFSVRFKPAAIGCID